MLSRIIRLFPEQVRFLLPYYGYGLLTFFFFRLLLLVTEWHQLQDVQANGRFLFSYWAFQVGARFDTVVSCYLLALPALVLTVVQAASARVPEFFYRVSHIYLLLLYSLTFFICAADIPFFSYNFSRLNAVVFNWFGNMDFVTGMIAQESSYFVYFFVFLATAIGYCIILHKRFRRFVAAPHVPAENGPTRRSLSAIFILALVFMGIRGRTQAPIRIENAFLTNYAFTNQLGLNPVFTLLVSWVDEVKLMPPDQAVAIVRKCLGTQDNNSPSPLQREVKATGEPLRKNIVLVLMESMSAEKMTRFGNPNGLTPHLDSIANLGWCFNRMYSAGKHTFNGIYATLYGYPAVLRDHPMSSLKMNDYTGLPVTLKQNGYNTIYFTTHLETFDNAGAFLSHNGFDKIISQRNYPKNRINNIFGVPDHYLFQFAVPKITQLSEKGKPFLATLLTTSDHGPYKIPDSIPFTPRPGDIRQQIVEYADWSIGRFLQLAAQQPWYPNTVFVFVADHGGLVGNNVYDMPLSYNHIPVIIFSPDTSFIQPRSYNCFGGQIDVFPTLMGLLHFSYTNNTFGVDLLREQRPFMFFSADDKIGCINNDYFYVWRQQGEQSLYDWPNASTTNMLPQHQSLADSMRAYALGMVQCSKWMIDQGLTGSVGSPGKQH